MDFNIDRKIENLEDAVDNIKKTGSTGSLLGMIPVAFNYLFQICLFLLKKERERMKEKGER